MCFLTSVVVYHESLTLGGSTKHFTTNEGLKVMACAQYGVYVTMQFGNFEIHAVTTRMFG